MMRKSQKHEKHVFGLTNQYKRGSMDIKSTYGVMAEIPGCDKI